MSAFVASATHIDVLLSVAPHGPSDGIGARSDGCRPYLDEAGTNGAPDARSLAGLAYGLNSRLLR
jgi:hypothetical protein